MLRHSLLYGCLAAVLTVGLVACVNPQKPVASIPDTETNGLALNGLALNGLALNGMALNGMYLNGMYLNGMYLNGTALAVVRTAPASQHIQLEGGQLIVVKTPTNQ